MVWSNNKSWGNKVFTTKLYFPYKRWHKFTDYHQTRVNWQKYCRNFYWSTLRWCILDFVVGSPCLINWEKRLMKFGVTWVFAARNTVCPLLSLKVQFWENVLEVDFTFQTTGFRKSLNIQPFYIENQNQTQHLNMFQAWYKPNSEWSRNLFPNKPGSKARVGLGEMIPLLV